MAANSINRETFLARLRESGLLSPEHFQQVYDAAAATDRGRVLARSLVERGLLTRFQAEMLLAGRTEGFVLGQYRILEQIGHGGMGRVFKAEHQTMNRIVALKVLSSALTRTDRAKGLFQREVRAAARLLHPNIVTAYDANQISDRHYLVMEYVNGPNLQELVQERGPLPIGQACEFIRQAALGLQYAHELGMVHRDIKPANLLVHRAGGGCVVKILDFGLARLHEPRGEQLTLHDSLPGTEAAVMGTPDFLSPEQSKNLHAVDIRSDLYSLGCTLYFLLTGQVPFDGGTALEKLVRHASEEAPHIAQLRPEVPVEVIAIVSRLMAKKPEDRHQTPIELAAALQPYSQQGSGTFKPLGSGQSGREIPSTGESPWADLMDDTPDALIGTLPANMSMTPMSSLRFPIDATAHLNASAIARKRWPRIAVLVGTLLVGFALGALIFARL